MNDKKLYIIAGCNGAGKTTASFNILPDILSCKEYVNADEIAKGISPFQPEKVAFEAGRVMLNRINDLLETGQDFAFETTLSSRIFKNFIVKAKTKGYIVNLIFFWLESENLAEKRVQRRVQEGGHNIPNDVIKRRYYSGIKNLFYLYFEICDLVLVYDNSMSIPELIYERDNSNETIYNSDTYNSIKSIII